MKKKRVAGEAASAERRNKSDSFDSWVMATEGETGGKKGRKKTSRRSGPGWSGWLWACMSPKMGAVPSPCPLTGLD